MALNSDLLTAALEAEGLRFYSSASGASLVPWGASAQHPRFDLIFSTMAMHGGFSMLCVHVDVATQPAAPPDVLAVAASAWNAANRWPTAFVRAEHTPASLIGQLHLPLPEDVTVEQVRWLVRLGVVCGGEFASMVGQLASLADFGADDAALERLLESHGA